MEKMLLNKIKSLDIWDAPRCPYDTNLKWNKYYWERPMVIPQYENDYWGKAIDPDGNLRDMTSEKEWNRRTADIQWLADIVNTHEPSGKILDIGCGPGYFLSRVNAAWGKYGVDISQVALESCARFASVQRGEFPTLEYPHNFFDIILMNHVIEHVPHPEKYVEAVHATLKTQGVFIIATPDFDSACARRYKEKYRMLNDTGHISLFTTHSLIHMLEDFGFRILFVEYPYFDSIFFNKDDLLRMFDKEKTSPPFYGNHVVVFAEKK